MSKPITPITDAIGDNYLVDAIVEEDCVQLPEMVQANLRHLLVACELGDLVLIQCISRVTGFNAYILCARIMTANDTAKLLPICEIADTDKLMRGMRPPSTLTENAFAKPTYTGNYVVDVVEYPDGTVALVEQPAEDDEGSKH